MVIKMKKILVLTVLLSMLTSLGSCGFIVINDPEQTSVTSDSDTSGEPSTETIQESTSSAPETRPEPSDPRDEISKKLAALPDRTLGQTVIIAQSGDGSVFPTASDDETSTARIISYRAVEEKYGTKIIPVTYSREDLLTEAKNAYAADTYFADLLLIPADLTGAFMNAKILANMSSLPFTDYSGENYNSGITSASRLGERLLAVSGAACLDYNKLGCVYFNRALAAEITGDSLYDIVKDGNWTYDRYASLAKDAAGNLNGVSGHGSPLTNSEYIDMAASSAGIVYVSNPAGEYPTVDYMDGDKNSALASGIVDTLYRMFYSDQSLIPSNKPADISFSEGTLLFLADRLERAGSLADSDTEWGLLPLPKYDEQQKDYISPLSADAPVFAAMANTPDFAGSGLLLEALNVSAGNYISDVYLNEKMNFTLRDNGSISSLSIILDSASLDFAHMFASGFSGLEKATYGAIYSGVTTRSTITALYKNLAPAANRELQSARLDR